jgi:16S rRNA (guanine966-N2)-methyltransferase
MRIISGMARGIRLQAPAGGGVRPTTDRVKESMFGVLGDLRGTAVLDLFAGSGALGLEAVSRGAVRACFVETEGAHIRILRENLQRVLKSIGPEADCAVRILQGDARCVPQLLAEDQGTFDIVFADPPYTPGPGRMGPEELLHDTALAAWLGDALLVLEHPTKAQLPWHPVTTWKLIRRQAFGTTTVSFARPEKDDRT